jgi:hypothetical protein
VALSGKMTETQAKKLVEWVKAGNQPEDFTSQNATKTKKQVQAPSPQASANPQTLEAIKQKLQSGEKLNMGENIALVAHGGKKVAQSPMAKSTARFFQQVFTLIGRETFRTLKGTVRFIWHSVREVFRGLGMALGKRFRKIAAFMVSIAILVPILWLIADTVFHGNFNAIRALHGFLAFAEPVLRMIWNMI